MFNMPASFRIMAYRLHRYTQQEVHMLSKHGKGLSNQKGLTLAELMIVISVVAILSLIGISSFSSSLPQYRLKATARDLVADMRLARQQAATENWQYAIQFLTPTSYTIVRGADQALLQSATSLVTVKTVTAARDISWTMPVGMPLFRPNGLISRWDPSSNTVTAVAPDPVVLTNPDADTKTVIIGASGHTRIQ